MKFYKLFILSFVALIAASFFMGCDEPPPSSDQKQQDQQENILSQATNAVGMPNIVNFRERKLFKYVIEKCDQEGLVTYTYLENMNPVVVHGKTALGGKLTFFGQSIGYGIPYATEYTSPQKVEFHEGHNGYGWGNFVMPQADPNALFKPASAEGTWVIMADPKTGKAEPQYVEPRIVTLTYELPLD